MIRAFAILLLSCLPLCAAAPLWYAPTTNNLVAIQVVGVKTNYFSMLGGFTNVNSGKGGPFALVSTNGLTVDIEDIFPSTISTQYWQRLGMPASQITTGTFGVGRIPNLPASQITSGVLPSTFGGTDTATVDLGDLLYGTTANFWARVPGNIGLKKFLTQTGNGTISAAPAWNTLVAADVGSGATLTAGAGLIGTTAGATLVPVSLAVDTTANFNWTGSHKFEEGNVDFRDEAAFSATPQTVLKGTLKINTGGTFSTVAQMTFAKENATEDNNAGRWSVSTRPNGGAMTQRILIDSAGLINIPGLTASRVIGTDSSGNLSALDAPSVDGYVLSSTIAGVKSWVANGGGTPANLSVETGVSITAGTGTGATLQAVTLAVNTATAFNWTGLQTWTSLSNVNPPVRIIKSNPGDGAFSTEINGESFQRYTTFANGAYIIGSGSAAADTSFGRSGVGVLTVTNIVSAITGFRVNGGATDGNYLRGNGSSFVSSTIQAGDLPAGAKPKIYSKASETTIANTTSTTTFFFATEVGSTNIAQNTLAAGDQIRLRLGGYYITKVLTPGNFSISFYLAGQTESITLSGFPANVSSTVGVWWAEYNWSIMTIGATGTVAGQGSFTYTNPLVTDTILGGGAKRSSTTIDTTADIGVNVAGTWATADALNSITCEYATIELLK